MLLEILLNVMLNAIAAVIQVPLLIFHALGLEIPLSLFDVHFSRADNVSSPLGSRRSSRSKEPTPKPNGSLRKKQGQDQDIDILHKRIIDAVDIVEIVHAHGYKIHEHVVQTRDGYLLSVHRILKKEATSTAYLTESPVVYMHHGLLTNSELFVLGDKTSKCLPFLLVDAGYDVWLGNNRGNKYSRKHLTLSSLDAKFWDYSLDEFAMFDIPDTIDHILDVSKKESVTYIGFSQGSAQCLAALSLSAELNRKINLFIGLSPAMIPKGLNHPIFSFFVESAPNLMYRLFGCRAILPSVVFWQKLMGPSLYEDVVTKSVTLLFGWTSDNISSSQKKVGYAHMFSPSSVKSVVHWFQIISNRRFQMFDEGGSSGSRLVYWSGVSLKTNRVAPFPTQTITTPMHLIYGKADSLVDIDKALEHLPISTTTYGVETYEHMDVLWAKDVEKSVFENVFSKLDEYHVTTK
ncbi:unnamed protein product [Ambrosiozyma monospora]|uniref:Unnamed protein product n=1 Tax=Ambrosiozyma monospora TaxID=43982 RepID=A0A9W7DCS5_AMBMO|nr:unnamed protein product [Ambrosiozyma monospora]